MTSYLSPESDGLSDIRLFPTWMGKLWTASEEFFIYLFIFAYCRYFLGKLWGRDVHQNAVCSSGAAAGSWRSDAGAQEGSVWSVGRDGTSLKVVRWYWFRFTVHLTKVLSSVLGFFPPPVLLINLWYISWLKMSRWWVALVVQLYYIFPQHSPCLFRCEMWCVLMN